MGVGVGGVFWGGVGVGWGGCWFLVGWGLVVGCGGGGVGLFCFGFFFVFGGGGGGFMVFCFVGVLFFTGGVGFFGWSVGGLSPEGEGQGRRLLRDCW